jgi:predicted nucleotidyltransferase
MAVTPAQRRLWQQRLQAEVAAVTQRRQGARRLALAAAQQLQVRWPELVGVWLFGSLNNGRFGLASDVDLALEGLPETDLLQAMALLEPLQGADDPGGIALDLVRLEDLDPHWQQRIRQRAEQLLNQAA